MFYFFNSLSTVHSSELSALPTALLLLLTAHSLILNRMSESETDDSSFVDDADSGSVSSSSTELVGDESEEDDENYVSIPGRIAAKRRPKKSWVWSYFKPAACGEKEYCFCMLCSKDVKYGKSCSIGMLEHHMKNHHVRIYNEKIAECALRMVQDENSASASSLLMPSPDKTGGGSGATATVVSNLTSSQSSLVSHLIPCPQFEVVLLKWMVKSFQPLSLVEDEDFREVCKALNKRSPILAATAFVVCLQGSII